MDIRQSQFYKTYLQAIGWQVEKIDNWNIFIRNIPLYGRFSKLQKIKSPIPFNLIHQFKKDHSIRTMIIEPDIRADKILTAQFLIHKFTINNSPYIPTKTILIDLKREENEIFNSFSSAKRRAIRKAMKNNVVVKVSDNISTFINLKVKHMFPIHHLMARDIQTLWESFPEENKKLLIAYKEHMVLAGILLLFFDNKSYYWLAASNTRGNQLAAPTLLVWEALKLSKEKQMKLFDFEGIYDKRFPNATNNWKGFTKFKEGFDGKQILYVGSFSN